jgi:hypothetical protein
MKQEAIQALAAQWKVPADDLQALALIVAQRCARIARHFEAQGELSHIDDALVASVGAAIGDAIEAYCQPPTTRVPSARLPAAGAARASRQDKRESRDAR